MRKCTVNKQQENKCLSITSDTYYGESEENAGKVRTEPLMCKIAWHVEGVEKLSASQCWSMAGIK